MRRAIVILTSVGVVAGACASERPEHNTSGSRATTSASSAAPAPGTPASATDIDGALQRSVLTLAASIPDVDDIPTLMVFDYLSRNWTVAELAPAAGVARDRLRAGSELSEPGLGRLVDPAQAVPDPLPDPAAGQEQLLGAALYCDVVPVTSAFVDAFESQVDAGGRDATHAALALGWMKELGCDIGALGGAGDRSVDAVATELARAKDVTDLSIEQAAFLAYLGVPDRIPAGWIARVIDAQRPDGAWGETPEAGAPAWHTTLLATWLLLAAQRPGLGVPMVLAAAVPNP